MRCWSTFGISWWMIPLPDVIHWTSPEPMIPLFPRLSSCSTRRSSMYVTVSIPRCGCQGKPATYSAGFSDRKSSRRRKGSRRGTSAAPNARCSCTPAPSMVGRAARISLISRGRSPGEESGSDMEPFYLGCRFCIRLMPSIHGVSAHPPGASNGPDDFRDGLVQERELGNVAATAIDRAAAVAGKDRLLDPNAPSFVRISQIRVLDGTPSTEKYSNLREGLRTGPLPRFPLHGPRIENGPKSASGRMDRDARTLGMKLKIGPAVLGRYFVDASHASHNPRRKTRAVERNRKATASSDREPRGLDLRTLTGDRFHRAPPDGGHDAG